MLWFLKGLFRKPADTPVESQEPPAPAPAPARPAAPPRRPGVHHNGNGVELPLREIVKGLPLELQPRLRNTHVGDLTISVPLEKILSQLSRGSVKISFGELRLAAPELFSAEDDRDRVLVPLPLGEILARLNPALIARRRVQRQVEVPVDVTSPFDQGGQGLVFSISPTKPEPTPAARQAPPPRQAAPPPPMPVVPLRRALTSAPTPPPPTALPPTTPAAMPPARPTAAATPPARAARPLASTPAPAAPASVPQPQKPAGEPPLLLELSVLAEGWPEAVRQEIVQLSLAEAQVALPTEVVERALKQGRIAFTWKILRSWIKPTPRPAVSAHDGAVLELPLKVVAPAFLARQKEAGKTQQKVTIDEEIPNLFFGFPQPEAGGAAPAPVANRAVANPAAPRPSDTNYYVWDDSSDTVRFTESEVRREAPSPGTRFVAKYATPNEVVSRAAALDGVAGALIALPDGLMVASRLAPDLNGETLAAFLPQIFGKVSQCTRELRMGELNNLNFTVGNVPWKIFRVNAIFFAAFGRSGEPLPTGQLAALAAELDHKPK